MRNFGVAPPLPKDTMWADRMLAPAEVPAINAPRRCAARIASPSGVPTTRVASLTWLPPVMKTAVARSTAATRSGAADWARLSGRIPTTSATPSVANSCR